MKVNSFAKFFLLNQQFTFLVTTSIDVTLQIVARAAVLLTSDTAKPEGPLMDEDELQEGAGLHGSVSPPRRGEIQRP